MDGIEKIQFQQMWKEDQASNILLLCARAIEILNVNALMTEAKKRRKKKQEKTGS